jgi:ferredoxin
VWPTITSKKEALPDADANNGKPNKRGLLIE